jgi:Mce-associated membrane protein
VVAMAVLAVVLLAVGVVLLVAAPGGSSQSNLNVAVVHSQTTAQVVGQVDTALERVLSYKYSDPGPTKTAAQQALVGPALQQYNVLFNALQQKAGTQKLTLVSKVVASGVTSLVGTKAQLLVFLDQSSTRASDGKTSAVAAQIQVGAVETNGVWKINELVPL